MINLSKEKFRLIKNFFGIGFYQLNNFIFQLLLTPFLINRVGILNFGLISTGVGISIFLSVITEFGFNYVVTKDIALNLNKKVSISILISNTLTTKLFLVVFAFLIQFFIFISNNFYQYKLFYLLSFALVLGKSFFPIWYFQGTEKMNFLVLYSFFSKTISFILLYFIIIKPDQYIFVNFIIGLVDFIASIIILILINKKYKIYFLLFKFYRIIVTLKNGLYFFLSSLFIVGYSSLNIVFLNFFISGKEIGYYALAEKIILIFKLLPVLIFQAVYPYSCKLKSKSELQLANFINKLFWFLLIFFLIVVIFINVFSFQLISFFTQSNIENVLPILNLLSVLPLSVALNIPAYLMLVVNNKQKNYFRLILITFFLCVLLNLILIPSFGVLGGAFSVILSEIFIALSLHFYIVIKCPDLRFLNFKLSL